MSIDAAVSDPIENIEIDMITMPYAPGESCANSRESKLLRAYLSLLSVRRTRLKYWHYN